MEILLKKPTIKTFLPFENLPLNKSLILKLQIILLILLYIGIYRFFPTALVHINILYKFIQIKIDGLIF